MFANCQETFRTAEGWTMYKLRWNNCTRWYATHSLLFHFIGVSECKHWKMWNMNM